MSFSVPKLEFSNGRKVPIFGLGTWKSKPGEVSQAVKDAIDIGYRHIDCAHIYGNEKEVGQAINAKLDEGVVKREDLFVTSKLWNTFHRPDLVEGALKDSLANLGLSYLDLYLIHWPIGYLEEGPLFPTNKDGSMLFSEVDYVDTWKALEACTRKGLVKSIGLSNFNKKQIERVLKAATVRPVNLQVECHPYLNQSRLIEFCRSKRIQVTAYSPLGSPDRPWAKPDDPVLLDDHKLKEIAKKYNKTVAQLLLRYQVQRNIITIPKSVTKSRIAENFQVFDFALTDDDVKYLDSFNCNGRICPMTPALGHPHHPFENDEY
ncbi:PREDICTED: aldose reductase-like [Nicrophorus vespilloides]|uniref:Aldose reductase-like n=1 Tax=Nicrophorus vespilloides TaxID=110193 RepID=A0ABM1NH65_NICVS|nr:PREDICTED: aldose reductase-like [Nicrophorus vespilloides]XP_017786165.1 PREDICTED: aldose reductase-like [Nicrophorus vespilloides]